MVVDKEEYKRRLSICEKCDKRNMLNMCKECGCFIAAKAKLAMSSCPLEKWTNTKDISILDSKID
jgi:hypothetical protein